MIFLLRFLNRLRCGHICPLHCHTYDKDHTEYTCQKRCHKPMKCGHTCMQICSHDTENAATAACDTCMELVEKKIATCGHTIRFRCDTEPTPNDCTHPCTKQLACGHACVKKCGVKSCEPCDTKQSITIGCKHESVASIRCGYTHKTWSLQTKCNKTCGDKLECGHECASRCGYCSGGYIHDKCEKPCARLLFCGHKCNDACAMDCMPCESMCENRCMHAKCRKSCYKPCATCRLKCGWACEHKKCGKTCAELCDRSACNEPCKKRLKACGHACIGLCGEKCPKLCRICDHGKVAEKFFGGEDHPHARFVLLDDCHHIFEVNVVMKIDYAIIDFIMDLLKNRFF